MTPLDTAQLPSTRLGLAFEGAQLLEWKPLNASDAARTRARLDRENPRLQTEWHTRRKREQVRQVGERLARALINLRTSEAQMTLAEARVLSQMVGSNRYQLLGFVRQSDFACEALKIHPRTFRRRIALHRVLKEVPALVEPFLGGRIGVSQVLALSDVVNADNVKIWLNVAERLSVRELRSLTRRAKKKRRAEDGEGAVGGEAENVVPEVTSEETDVGDPGSETDPLEEPRRQTISFLSPQSAAFAIEHGLETAKRALGWEAPRDECLEAILSEADSTLALPPAEVEENVVPSEAGDTKTTSNTPDESPERASNWPIWHHKREVKAAKRLLNTIERKLAQIERLAPPPRSTTTPGGAASDEEDLHRVTVESLLDRFRAIQQQKNPIRVLIARAYYHLCLLGAGGLLGFKSESELATRLLKVTPRSARDLATAGFGFNYFPPLADAYSRGQIGFGQVVSLSHAVNEGTRDWIERAKQVTTRQFRREVRLLRRLADAIPQRVDFLIDAFPRPDLEGRLRRHLLELGWSPDELDRELGGRGILSPPDASTDPAENPALMARLETLTDLIALEQCRREDTLPVKGKLLSVPGRHRRVTILARDSIARHWHDSQTRILAECDHLPDWAVATVLVKAAQDEWDRRDPDRIPTEARILERDGYLCQAPGCSSRKNLEVHHIIFRSLGGTNDDWNLITLCHMHHHHAVHRHTMRVTGKAPYSLTWEVGLDPTDKTPARWTFKGERRVCTNSYP